MVYGHTPVPEARWLNGTICIDTACVFGGNCNGAGGGGIGVNPATIPTDGVTIDSAIPRITAVFPSGTDVDRNSPIVIVFSESMSPTNANIAFELAATGTGGGTLPFGVTSLLAEGRVLVLMPLTQLLPSTSFQVRFRTGVSFSDLTGQVVVQPADRVVGTFTTAAMDADAPELLTTWPVDAATDQSATGEILAIFTRPIAPGTVTDASFAVTVAGVAPTFDPVAQPLTANGGLVTDTRVYRYRSVNALGVPVPFANSALVRVALSPNASPIRDTGNNALAPVDFDFRTAPFGAPSAAVITSAPSDAIGIDQITGPANLAMLVTVPDGQDGDSLLVTIFGTQVTTEMNPPVIALQRTTALEAPFTSFTLAASDLNLASGGHGVVADGSVGFAIQLKRGTRISPVRMLDVDPLTSGVQSPILDTVAPTLTGLGTSGTAVGTFRSDLRDLAIVGRASEPLRSVLVETPSNGDNDFGNDGFPAVAGSHRSGLFVAAPVALGQLAPQQSVGYSVTIFDRALNSGGTVSGTFRQLGASGPGTALPGGTIQVEVYDGVTLAPLAGASVFTHENLAGTVTSVANATTAVNGIASLAAAPTGETIVTVFATGYDLFTFDGVPTDRLSVPLHPASLQNAGTRGDLTTTIAQMNLFTRGFTDTRTLSSSDRIAPVSACTFDQTQTRFECPFGPVTVRAREIGAQSAIAVQIPANIFLYSPLTFLQGFNLQLPVPAVEPGQTQTNDVDVPVLLSDAATDPEERAIDGPPLVLSTVNYPQLSGSPRVTVESVAAGVRANPVVGQGVAFDLMPPSTNWAVRAAYPGAVDGIPDVTGLDGSGHVTGRTAAFNATAGSMETAPGRKLAMASGSFGLPWNDGLPATPAFVEAKLGGSVEAVADLLSRDAIKDFASLPLEPGSLKGQVDGRLRVDFKVGPAATGQDVKIGVNANVSNFTADHLLGKERFEAGTLTVVGDPGGIKANGSGRMFGLPASLDLRKDVGQPTIVNLSASVDEAARARFGMGSPAITGPAGLKLTAVFDRDTKVGVDLDLTRVGLNNPVPGVTKAAGRPGRATFNLVQRDNAIRIDDLVADLGGPSARGSIELSGQGEFIAARLSQAKVSPGDDMRIEIVKMGEAYRTTVRGASLDARPFIKSVTQGGDGRKENDDFELDLKMPVLSGFQRQSIVNADMRVSRKNGALRALSMSGQFGRGPFSAVLARGDNGQPQVNVSSADAGALLGFTDLYARMEGGSLTAAMQFGDRTVTGMLNVKTFFLRDEPSLRRLVTEGSVRVDSNGARVDPTLVRFDRLSAVFSRTGGLLTVRDGVMNGPNIGLTFEGQIDSDRDALALNGTFIPAYTVNNFFAKIPVVGLLLGGGWNEGLFAINYRIAGRMSAPQVSVNPLTVAPGFLRKIFGAFDNATSAPPTR